MEREATDIPDVFIIRPKRHRDERGFFSETFKSQTLAQWGVDLPWIQDNHSFSTRRGVVRGLHFQAPPFAQAKIIRVTRGAILDVAVDIRSGSATYGRHVAVELSAQNWAQLFVPVGFAHGFATLTDDTEVMYKVTAPYSPDHEGGVLWRDEALAIHWPMQLDEAIVNDRDSAWPGIETLKSPF